MPKMTKRELEVLRKAWESRITDFRGSGQAQAKWCAANRVSVRQLQYWLRKFPLQESESRNHSAKWMAIQLDESMKDVPSQSVLSVRVGSAVIEVRDGYNPSLLLGVVKVLQTLC